MRRYETFNPAIPEESENKINGDLPVYNDIEEGLKINETKKNAARRHNVKTEKSKTKTPKKTPQIKDNSLVRFFNGKTFKWLVGLLMSFFAIYLAIAFISYFVTCVKDQSEINNTPIGFSGEIANAAGEGGARLSEFLINEFFGLGSFVIIVWLIAMGLRMISGKPRLKPVNFTIKCLVALITVSLIVGLLTIGLQSSVNWGGYHGRYVNEFIIHFLGWSGAIILCIFMLCCFVAICMRDVVKWALKKKASYDEKRKIKREIEEEKRRKEQELDEMRLAEDRGFQPSDSRISEDNNTQLNSDYPAEFSFGDFSNLYSEIQDIDDEEFTYNLESKFPSNVSSNKTEEFPEDSDDNKEEDDNYSLPEEEDAENDLNQLTRDTNSKDLQEIDNGGLSDEEVSEKKDNILSTEEKEVSDKKSLTPEEKTEDDELSMVVNVNSISEVKDKTGGMGINDPGKFPYKFPSFDILAPGESSISVDADEQLANKEQIRRTLLDFDIPIVSIEATVGPTVTLYEIVPDKGIRVSKIRALVDDISLSLSAEHGVRIIAPIPGKGTVGIEVANKVKQTVSMRTVLKSQAFHDSKAKLPVALGSTISNEVFVTDLAKMPHLLVAGATGQGKSVGLNAIITSLLYSKRPDELKFVMIDPKMVEFSLYAKIEGHYLAKIPDTEDAIITDMDKVVATLNSLCIEMDNRYQLLKDASVRNIIEYNDKIKAKRLNPNEGHRFLPYIVVIVDEFSDLIMTAGRDVEQPIARLAQKARAVGMHVIVATQRPSTNVITGIIKANFPARIAFKVSSGVDSKTILDTTGAQQLIGRGDMLVSNSAPMVRVQCAFIDTPEVEKVCDHILAQPYAQGAYILPEPNSGKNEINGESNIDGNSSDRDPLFEEVARLVVQTNNASTSSVQRRYRIGYNRAGSIMDQLEHAGIVGPAQGGKPRSVLMDMVSLEALLEN